RWDHSCSWDNSCSFPADLPAGLGDPGAVTGKCQFADLAAGQAELTEGATGATGQLVAVAQTGGVGVAGQLLQLQTGGIAFVVGLAGVIDDGLELGVLAGVLGHQLFALFLALLQRDFSHAAPQFLNGNLKAASRALAS